MEVHYFSRKKVWPDDCCGNRGVTSDLDVYLRDPMRAKDMYDELSRRFSSFAPQCISCKTNKKARVAGEKKSVAVNESFERKGKRETALKQFKPLRRGQVPSLSLSPLLVNMWDPIQLIYHR